MNIIIDIKGKIFIYLLTKQITLGVIDADYGLIRYLLKIVQEYVLTKTKNGYLQFLNKKGETYLHRIIMEYYSQFDDKLFSILNNPDYEVNHKNKKKWDNRLENLEMVTRLGNERHKSNKAYEEEIVYTTDELLKLQESNKKIKDKKYLEKVSKRNLEFLSSDNFYRTCNNTFYTQPYIRCNNVTIHSLHNTHKERDTNTLDTFDKPLTLAVKNTFSIVNQSNYLYNFNKLTEEYNYSRANIISNNNLRLIKKYYNSIQYFREVCEKYYIYNPSAPRVCPNINDYNSYIEPSVIEYIYNNITYGNHVIIFYQNTLLTNFNAQGVLLNRGKYNTLRVIFLLELFERINTNYTHIRTKHRAYAFSIHKYTDEFFSSTVLPGAQQLYKMDLSKITHTILTKNFNTETANKVYCNSRLKEATETNIIIIDQLKLLLSSTLLEEINTYGFLSFGKIRRVLKDYNDDLKNQSLPSFEITEDEKALKFISGIVRNVTDIKQLLEDLKIEYRIINKNTKISISEFQKKNGLEDTTEKGLYYNQRILVLKKLYKPSR